MRATLLAMVCCIVVYAVEPQTTPSVSDLAGLQAMASRFEPTPLNVDVSGLSAGDRKALVKLIQAAKIVNHLFMEQFWSGDLALYQDAVLHVIYHHAFPHFVTTIFSSGKPKRAATSCARCCCCSGVGPSSSQPHPQNFCRRSTIGRLP